MAVKKQKKIYKSGGATSNKLGKSKSRPGNRGFVNNSKDSPAAAVKRTAVKRTAAKPTVAKSTASVSSNSGRTTKSKPGNKLGKGKSTPGNRGVVNYKSGGATGVKRKKK